MISAFPVFYYILRDPTMLPETCRLSLRAGFFFRIVVSAKDIRQFLFFFVERSPFSFHSWIREAMGSHYSEGERPDFFTWIWRKSSAFEDAKKVSCKRAWHTGRKKRVKERLYHRSRFESRLILLLYSRHWNILGLFGQRISGRIEGFHFLFYVWEISYMALSSESRNTLFHIRVISLEISIKVSWLQMM